VGCTSMISALLFAMFAIQVNRLISILHGDCRTTNQEANWPTCHSVRPLTRPGNNQAKDLFK